MAKYKLEIEDDYDFVLFGICTHISDFRLAWLFNQSLGVNLVRSAKDLINYSAKQNRRTNFSCFDDVDDEHRLKIYLINNNSGSIKLVPDKKQFDFFLMIKGEIAFKPQEWLKEINQLKEVLLVMELDPMTIKHKENLIFDE